VNSKKELLGASLLAIALSAGLGTISYGLFAATPPAAKLSVLGLYTPKSGIGVNVSGGDFEPFDSVPVYAYLTQGGVQVMNSQVTFTIKKPDGTETVRTALTDNSGVAKTVLSFLPSEGHLIGTWQILANASVNNETLDSMVTLQCKSQNARIDVFSKRNGASSTSFLPNDEVFLEAQLSYKDASIAGAPVTFEVKTPNNTDFISQTVPTDNFGTANVTFQIPWPSDLSLGTWQVAVTSEVFEQTVNAIANFDCKLVPPVIDVYTQKGGQGPNTAGGTFVLNETVFLYAEIRGILNQTVPKDYLVAFELIYDNKTSVPWTKNYMVQGTNVSGIANVTTRIPTDPSYAGNWEVYTTAEYNGIVLIDTLTFTVREQP
jgi:hypothetical protein